MKHLLTIAALTIAALLTGCLMPRAHGPTAAAPTARVDYQDPSFDHSREEAQQFLADQSAGFEPVGETRRGRLEAFAPWSVQLERGYCYRMAISFAPETEFSAHARRGIVFLYEAPGEATVNAGPGMHGPAAIASAGCPQRDQTAHFDIRANWGSATDQSRIHELGSGRFMAQLIRKPIGEDELAALEADRQRQIAESEAFEREYRAREAQRQAEREARWAAEDEARAAAASRPSSPAPASDGPLAVTVRNRCRETVHVFYGDDPRFGSGTQSTLSGNSVNSRSFRPGDQIWLTDPSRNGISSVTVSQGTREVTVTESCTGLSGR